MSILSFNFRDKEHCSYEVIKGIRVHFECVEPNIAHMYFTNSKEEYIDVPKESVAIYKYITVTDKVIHQITDPLLEHMHNKKRTGYLYTYYLLNKNEEYEICYKYAKGYNKYNNIELFFKSMRLVPQHSWEMVNHQWIDFKVHS